MKTIVWLLFLGCILFGFSSCQNNASPQITEADMEKFINENIPLGTSSSDVEAYLRTLKFGSRSLIVDGYFNGRFNSISVEDSQPAKVYSHVLASLPDAWSDRHGLLGGNKYWLRMAFYFDEKEKLIGHSVYSLPDS